MAIQDTTSSGLTVTAVSNPKLREDKSHETRRKIEVFKSFIDCILYHLYCRYLYNDDVAMAVGLGMDAAPPRIRTDDSGGYLRFIFSGICFVVPDAW